MSRKIDAREVRRRSRGVAVRLRCLVGALLPGIALTAVGVLGAPLGGAGGASGEPSALPAAPADAAAPAAAPPAASPPERPVLRLMRSGGLRVESAALLMSGQQGGAIDLAVLAVPWPAAAGKGRVDVMVEIDGRSLLAAAGPDPAPAPLRCEVAFYALSGQGILDASGADVVEIDLARARPALERTGVRLHEELRLPAGEASLRVLVRLPATRQVGLRVVPLMVPPAPSGAAAAMAGGAGLAGAAGATGASGGPVAEAPPRLLTPLFAGATSSAAADSRPAATWLEARLEGAEPGPGVPPPESAAGAAPPQGTAKATPPQGAANAAPPDTEQPAAFPVLFAGRETLFELPAAGLPSSGSEGIEASVELRPAGGAVLPGGGLAARLLGRRPPPSPHAAPGLELLAIAFTPPGTLAAGAYELQAVVRLLPATPAARAGQRELRSSSLPVLVAAAMLGENALLWPQVVRAPALGGMTAAAAGGAGSGTAGKEAAATPDTAADGSEPSEGNEGKQDAAPRTRLAGFQAAYRAILGDVAAGRESAAHLALGELEAALLRDGALDLSRLAAVEIRTIRTVAAQAPEALVPVLHLYALLYAESRRAARYQLSTHAREMTFGLADLYARESALPAARQLAARLMISFGGELAAAGGPGGFTTKAWRRAAAWDPDGEPALLCLALDAEWRGEYRQALAALRQLLSRHPESAEGRLRLAVNLVRLGQQEEAERELERVARVAAGWPAAVAYQELGRLRIGGGRLAAAEQALQEGLRRLPDDESLAFELALVLERRGRSAEAAAVLARLRAAAPEEESSRHLYTRLPAPLLGRVDGEIKAAIAERLPALAAALAAGQQAGSR